MNWSETGGGLTDDLEPRLSSRLDDGIGLEAVVVIVGAAVPVERATAAVA